MSANTFVPVLTRWTVSLDPLDAEQLIITQQTELSDGISKKLYYHAAAIEMDASLAPETVDESIDAAVLWANPV